MNITERDLRRLAPNARADILAGICEHQRLLDIYGISTPLRWCHWVAQVAQETQGLTRLEENLSYSAERLCQVWPARYPTIKAAAPYARNPRALANHTYGGRMGNTGSDAGWIYRGRGLKMLTGRDNYAAAEVALDLPLTERPELAAEFPHTLAIACWYWRARGIGRHADRDDIEAVTRAVNGGLIGLVDRKRYLVRAKAIWLPSVSDNRAADDRAPVRELQERLNARARLNPPLVVDGILGPATQGAIRIFQGSVGLPATGEADEETRRALGLA